MPTLFARLDVTFDATGFENVVIWPTLELRLIDRWNEQRQRIELRR